MYPQFNGVNPSIVFFAVQALILRRRRLIAGWSKKHRSAPFALSYRSRSWGILCKLTYNVTDSSNFGCGFLFPIWYARRRGSIRYWKRGKYLFRYNEHWRYADCSNLLLVLGLEGKS